MSNKINVTVNRLSTMNCFTRLQRNSWCYFKYVTLLLLVWWMHCFYVTLIVSCIKTVNSKDALARVKMETWDCFFYHAGTIITDLIWQTKIKVGSEIIDGDIVLKMVNKKSRGSLALEPRTAEAKKSQGFDSRKLWQIVSSVVDATRLV